MVGPGYFDANAAESESDPHWGKQTLLLLSKNVWFNPLFLLDFSVKETQSCMFYYFFPHYPVKNSFLHRPGDPPLHDPEDPHTRFYNQRE